MINYQSFTKYFNQDLVKQLRPENSYLNNRCYFNLSDKEILYANMFISILEAGDKFEGNNYNIASHIDLSSYVAKTFPQLRKLIQYYCKVYNYYRNYAWKMICGLNTNIHDRIIRIEQFLSWMKKVGDVVAGRSFVFPNDNAYCDPQIKEQIDSGTFTLAPFIKAYLHLAVADDIIILPQSMRIMQLKGITVDNLLSENNHFLCQAARNVESTIAEIVNEMLDEDNE